MENDLIELENPTPKKHNTQFNQPRSLNPNPQSNNNKISKITNIKPSNRKFVFFVVHGLEASSFDMRQIRASIISNIPNAAVCLIQKNNDLTNHSIQTQGQRFAEEILTLINSDNISGMPKP